MEWVAGFPWNHCPEWRGIRKLAKRVMVPCERTIPEPSRFSLLHRGQRKMIDHLLVSRTLLVHYRAHKGRYSRCERGQRIAPSEAKVQAIGELLTGQKTVESDEELVRTLVRLATERMR